MGREVGGQPGGVELGDSAFTGTIKWVRLETGLDTHDHLIDPDHLFHIATMRE